MSLIGEVIHSSGIVEKSNDLRPSFKVYWWEHGPHCNDSVIIRQSGGRPAHVCRHPLTPEGKELPAIVPLPQSVTGCTWRWDPKTRKLIT